MNQEKNMVAKIITSYQWRFWEPINTLASFLSYDILNKLKPMALQYVFRARVW